MKEKKVLTCSKCGQHFTSKQNCIRHETNIHSMHGGVRKSYCPSCNSSFTRTADLSRHMRRQHGTLLSSVFGTPKAAPIELPTAINLPKIPKVKPAATVSQRPASPSAVDSSTFSEVTLEEDPLSGTCLKIDKPLNLAPRKRRKEDPKSPEKLTPRYGVRDRLLNLYSPAHPLNTPELPSRSSTPALSSQHWSDCLEHSEMWDVPTFQTPRTPRTPVTQTQPSPYIPVVSDISQPSSAASTPFPVIVPPPPTRESTSPLSADEDAIVEDIPALSPARTPTLVRVRPATPLPASPVESEDYVPPQTPEGSVLVEAPLSLTPDSPAEVPDADTVQVPLYLGPLPRPNIHQEGSSVELSYGNPPLTMKVTDSHMSLDDITEIYVRRMLIPTYIHEIKMRELEFKHQRALEQLTADARQARTQDEDPSPTEL